MHFRNPPSPFSQREFFSKTYPSFLTLKEGSTFLTKPLFPQGREDVTALWCSEPLRYKVGGASKPSPWLCGMGPPGVRWGIGWVLPCRKAWWQRMVIELGLLSGYLMVACFSQPSLSQKESSDSLVSPMNGRKGNENFSKC